VDSDLTVLGGKGFVLGEYLRQFHDPAIGHIRNVNERNDYQVYSENVLMGISTIHNFHIFTDVHIDINTNLNVLMDVLENWRKYQESTGKKGVFNFLSSWLVYGNQNTLPVPETSECRPSGLYSITKRCAEQMLISYCTTHGLNWRIMRLSNVVGANDKKVSAQKNGLQYMINKMANGENVEIYGDGEFYRDFTHVEDVASAIDLVIAKGNMNEIYNVGNGKTWAFVDIILHARKNLRVYGSVLFVEPKEFQKQVVVQTFYMDNSKLQALGYAPKYSGAKLYDSIIPKTAYRSHQCETS
jgi:nucleoside-diphosphate-sugar epimerase